MRLNLNKSINTLIHVSQNMVDWKNGVIPKDDPNIIKNHQMDSVGGHLK